MVKLTGLWKNTGKDGKTYLTGSVSVGARLMILPNTFKKSEREPDYFAYIAQSEKQKESKSDASEDGL